MNRTLSFLFISSFCFFIACNNERPVEEINSKDTGAESIWFDYQIWGEDGNDSVTIKLQYMEEENGATLTIEEPAKVELDGKPVPGNSSAMMGPYYELQQPVSTFTGHHTIRFTNTDGKQYKEDFTFQPILLKAPIPDTIKRGTIIFHLSDLKPGGYIRILMTDTAFASEGINRLDKITNGQVIIDGSDLSRLSNGPIQLELIREDERKVKDGTREGGRISIFYGLKREFILKD